MTLKLRKKAYNVQGVQDSALNASFGREVTVQQVAPGRHPATACKPRLDTRRKSMKIATWNVRTLYQEGKIENVIKEMDRMNLNIVGLAETRWTGAAVAKVDNKVFIFSGGSTHERGVGILFDESIEKSLKSWCPVSDRVVVAKFVGKPLDMGIVQEYAPTSTAEEEEVEQFYEHLDKAMKCLKSQDIKIVMGDFNAKVGSERVENIVGPWGIGEENERGGRLIEWCKENGFMISNTWYQNHPRRQWTWMSPGDRTRNKIDFILVQDIFRNAIKTSKSMPGADCDSDHVPVMCKLQVKLKKIRKPKAHSKLQVELLKSDQEIKEQFSIDIKNKFALLDSITEAETIWDNIKDSINEAFDKVKHEKLFEMLNQLDIDGKDLRVLRNLYWDQTAAVRVDGELSKIEGTRNRGRQRITFLDSLSSFVTGNNKDNIALLRMTEDRDRWRIMIADVCSRQGI
ncbi:hypothetical protein RRG08_041516 [Elysia crispata]|uniref:Endonuclease/exonuclease/phosphatase domain-containing protein n=1 Tax=Elysia crispata TaxID=231223 RepID=A0AAE1DIC2_9GAST|nr:hypothetical protein RRG08_041516 [Elysia crispata]